MGAYFLASHPSTDGTILVVQRFRGFAMRTVLPRFFFGLLFLAFAVSTTTAQERSTQQGERAAITGPDKEASATTPVSKKKLTLAKKLVEQGEAEIGAYEPPSRTYLCYLLGTAKMKLDRPAARELLLKCLTTSHSIEDKELREQLQGWI